MTSSSMVPDVPDPLASAIKRACTDLDLHPDSDHTPIVGLGRRSLSTRVTTAEGEPRWLRIVTTSRGEGKLREGPLLAAEDLPDAIPRPHLLDHQGWNDAEQSIQATVWSYEPQPPISATPDLTAPVHLDETWWQDLRTAVTTLAQATSAPESRLVLTQNYIHRIGRFLPEVTETGLDTTVHQWTVAHGDLHWANLTHTPLRLLDWEGWGWAPAGFDPALLHTYALPTPDTAARVRREFAEVLESPQGRLAELVVAAAVLQAAERDEVHARLARPVRRHAHALLHP